MCCCVLCCCCVGVVDLVLCGVWLCLCCVLLVRGGALFELVCVDWFVCVGLPCVVVCWFVLLCVRWCVVMLWFVVCCFVGGISLCWMLVVLVRGECVAVYVVVCCWCMCCGVLLLCFDLL